MSSICITGGAGFIGSHLADCLISLGHRVVIVDNLSTGSLQNVPPKARLIIRNIEQPLNDIFDRHGFEFVFHLAAQINLRHSIKEPMQDAQTNIIGSLNLLQECVRGNVKRVIFSSTGGAIYNPDTPLPWNEKSETNPPSPYGLSKWTIEKYLRMFERLYGLKSTILRYSNIYGARRNAQGEAGVISIFVERALKNEDIYVFGTGQQTRDMIYCSSVVNSNVLVMEQALDGIYNVSSNSQVSVNELAEKIITMTGSKSKIIYQPAIKGEILHTQLNADKLMAEGWENDVELDEGIKRTVEYFEGRK